MDITMEDAPDYDYAFSVHPRMSIAEP